MRQRLLIRDSSRGSSLILCLSLVGVLWIMMLGFANHATQSLRLARANLASHRALRAAESGLRVAVVQLEADPTYRPRPDYVSMGRSGESYKLFRLEGSAAPTQLPANSIYLMATGRDRDGTTRRVGAVVKLSRGKSSLLSHSVFANALDMSGGTSVDSFDSTVGDYPRGEEGHVATNATEPGSIRLNGGSHISGRIQVGPGGQTGEARPDRPTWNSDNVVWKNWSTWSLEESNLDRPLDFPPVSAPSPGQEDVRINWRGGDLDPGAYDTLTVNGGGEVRLRSGTYVFNEIKLTGGATLSFVGGSEPAVVYVHQQFDMSNGTVYNTTGRPRNLLFMMAGDSEAKLRGGAKSYMVVYGPQASIDLAGGSDLYGALVGKDVKIRGGSHIHYDVDLGRNPPSGLEGGGGGGGGGVEVLSWQRF